MISKLKLNNFLVGLIIVSFSVSISYFLGDGQRNILLICLMSFSPIIIIGNKKVNKLDLLLILFITSTILFPYINHFHHTKYEKIHLHY